MKPSLKISILLLFSVLVSMNTTAQFIKGAKKKLLNATSSSAFSESEAADAIKEALVKGTSESVSLVSQLDGYFGNKEIKIPLPQEAQSMESRLRSMGLDEQVDKAILSINRAAEDAATEAKAIFIDAIKAMTIQDAIDIVKGENNAATKYLQKSTTKALIIKFKPIIKKSLDKTSATKYWADLVNTYNKIPLVKKMNPDLPAYVTDKAIEGLFIMIAKEELKIRKDPVARTTELLKKVFGN